MGCCLSAGDRRRVTEPPRSPPAEEETVKEVLLETVPAVVAPKVDGERSKGVPLGNREGEVEAGPTAEIRRVPANPTRKDNHEIVSEVSEASEMCSYGESFSNATAQERRDEEEEDGVVNQRPPQKRRRGPSGGRGTGVGTRAGMAAPAPEKRGQVAPLRPVRGRPVAGQPRNAAQENGRQRGSGEGSGNRSRSPVGRGEAGAWRDVGEEKSTATREPPNDVVPAEEAESLENPIVSLECFIFL